MASISPISTQCSVLARHARSSTLSPPSPTSLSLTSSLSPRKSSSSSTGFGLSRFAPQRKDAVKTAAVGEFAGSVLNASGLRFAVVVARFNEIITKPLLEGALHTFTKYSVQEDDVDVVWVPGCFEIGIVAQSLGRSGKYDAVLCIGAVIRGDTSHYDAVVNSTSSGVLSAGLNSGVPCIFGVLTCDNMDQAFDRVGGKAGNKGSETALTAIETASLFEHHLKM